MSDGRLAAIELAKFVVSQRTPGRPMADEEIFELYRQCLAVVQEAGVSVPAAETDPQKIALALMALFNSAKKPVKKPAKKLADRRPKAKTRRHKRST